MGSKLPGLHGFRLQAEGPKFEVAGSSGDGMADSRTFALEHHIVPMIPNSPKEKSHSRPVLLRCKRRRRDLPDIAAAETTVDAKGTPDLRDAAACKEQITCCLGLPAAEFPQDCMNTHTKET